MIHKLEIIKDKEHNTLQDMLLQSAEMINEIIDWINSHHTHNADTIKQVLKSINESQISNHSHKTNSDSAKLKESRPDISCFCGKALNEPLIARIRNQIFDEVITHLKDWGRTNADERTAYEVIEEMREVK